MSSDQDLKKLIRDIKHHARNASSGMHNETAYSGKEIEKTFKLVTDALENLEKRINLLEK